MNMILQALQVMLFGMLGIFIVMGLIILSVVILNKLGNIKSKLIILSVFILNKLGNKKAKRTPVKPSSRHLS